MEKVSRQKTEMRTTETKQPRLALGMDVIAPYAPPFAFLVTLGFSVIYAIAASGFPNQVPPTQLLWIAGAAALAGLLFLPVPVLARNGKLILAESIMLAAYTFFLIVVAYVFPVSVLYVYILVWAFPLVVLWMCDTRKQRVPPLVTGALGTIILFLISNFLTNEQPAIDDLTFTIASFYLVFVIASWLGLIIIVRVIQFKSLTARLTSSFFLLVMIPTLITAIIAAFQSYSRDTNSVYIMLDTATVVKEQQINQVISGMFQDLDFMLRDPVAKQRFEFLFDSEPNEFCQQD